MRVLRLILLVGTMAWAALASEIRGTWKAVFTCPVDERPKMVSEMIFEFDVVGDKLIGMAHMANWPGDAPISDGRIDGYRFSFTTVGKHPWWATRPGGHASGLPKLTFTGTVRGTEMQVTLVWDSVMIYGDPVPPRRYEMKGKKISD